MVKIEIERCFITNVYTPPAKEGREARSYVTVRGARNSELQFTCSLNGNEAALKKAADEMTVVALRGVMVGRRFDKNQSLELLTVEIAPVGAK